jgi:tRNA(fMet)-specific endonuclease VapC
LIKKYDPFGISSLPVISVVTKGEIESISLRNKWGKRRLEVISLFLGKFVIADINSKDVIKRYGEIDAYSQGKLVDRPLDLSARNMGKNDLWIAATASVTGATILTADRDFTHLSPSFLHLELLEI